MSSSHWCRLGTVAVSIMGAVGTASASEISGQGDSAVPYATPVSPAAPSAPASGWATATHATDIGLLPPRRTPALSSKLLVEFGLLDPIAHEIQYGRSGTEFDYVKQGGQDVLFPTTRLSVEAAWKRRHVLVFLYQPIDLRTSETLRSDLLVDNVRFPSGTPIELRYGFDFYRVSYLYNFMSRTPNDEFSLGASLQLRNTVVDFTSADGQLRRSNRDVGPVPAIKARGRWHFADAVWAGFEADGMYAPVKYLNGGKSDVIGAILDFSLRGGYDISDPLSVFLNLRYLGGGASGTSERDARRDSSDGYTSNWLHFTTTTIGVELNLDRLFPR